MLKNLIIIGAGIFAVTGAALFSYISLEQTMGPRDVQVEIPTVSKKATTTKSFTTTAIASPKKSVVVVPKRITSEPQPKAVVAAPKEVVAPGPLRAPQQSSSATELTVSGIILETNIARNENGGLSPLSENFLLNKAAQMKVDDMFAKQYFEHVSPSGVGPSGLAQAVGYEYVVVGENLALGDFKGDLGVVTAWMNSPGHRANILKPQYREIGVAVGRGMYEGRTTWLAVQSFGVPLSACTAINANLKAEIDARNTTIASMRAALDAKKSQIDSTPTNHPNYNTYVNEFNAMLPEYNSLVETNRAYVATYNASVQAFNACIAQVSG